MLLNEPSPNLEATTMEDTVEKTAELSVQLEGRLAELEKANALLVAVVEKAREELLPLIQTW